MIGVSRHLLIALALVGAAAAVATGLASVASHFTEHGRQLERSAQRAQADEQYRESVRLGGQLAATARQEAASVREHAHQLQQEIARGKTPLVRAAVGACPSVAAAAPGHVASAGSGHPAPAGAAASPQDLRAQLPADVVLHLSADAVRLWDSALAGADIDAGACRAADPTSAACAAATAFTVDDAWRNHVENAQRCHVDRINHQRLIDYLNKAPSAQRPAPATE